VAYWSRVLAPAKTHYSATEREALAAKESLVHFQPFIEGERILLVTDHALLTWAKMYEKGNRRLAAWGLIFAAYSQLLIVHRPGRAHSNVDPLSRLPWVPSFISPAREDLPSPSASTEHEELQTAWETFIKEHKLAMEVKVAFTCPKTHSSASTPSNQGIEKESSIPLNSNTNKDEPLSFDHPVATHIFADKGTIQHFVKGYSTDKEFAMLMDQTCNEKPHEQKR
jgi:hypothetical protein